MQTMSEAVRTVIDSYPAGYRFHGNQLQKDVVRIFPEAKDMYPDTLLRMARRHRRHSFKAVDHNRSLYEKLYEKPILQEMKEIREEAEKKNPPPAAKKIQYTLFGVLSWMI